MHAAKLCITWIPFGCWVQLCFTSFKNKAKWSYFVEFDLAFMNKYKRFCNNSFDFKLFVNYYNYLHLRCICRTDLSIQKQKYTITSVILECKFGDDIFQLLKSKYIFYIASITITSIFRLKCLKITN